ncbi:MAG: ATP-binding protein [Micropruina sp.]|uniref:sensor histidine kinase n=1 Tax=Micropruina sp. TaxID=2737536 RepID=UPI0039E5B18E
MVYGSASQLDQVFLNLLNNAIDAVRDRKEPRIEVFAFVDDDFCKVAVHDNGAGLAPEISAHIFEPFHTTKARGSVSAWDSATAHRIVSNHHGTLSADRSPLGGAVFTISLNRIAARQPGLETAI